MVFNKQTDTCKRISEVSCSISSGFLNLSSNLTCLQPFLHFTYLFIIVMKLWNETLLFVLPGVFEAIFLSLLKTN